MLTCLLATYTQQRAQHNSSAKANYHKFNATQAYVQHTVAIMQLNMHYAAQAHNNTRCSCSTQFCKCATAHNLQYKINNALIAAKRKQQYAYNHNNFNLQHALQVLQAYNNAAQVTQVAQVAA
jgi:hypothetical protein